jgi:hypothetical protein
MAQVGEVGEVVAVVCEARIAVVAALNDMQRDAGKDEARVPGHHTQNDLACGALTRRLH